MANFSIENVQYPFVSLCFEVDDGTVKKARCKIKLNVLGEFKVCPCGKESRKILKEIGAKRRKHLNNTFSW